MAKKKIFLLYEFFSEMGGLERELINHAKFLRDAGYKIKILTCHIDKEILKSLDIDRIEIESIGSIKTENEFLNLVYCLLGFNIINKYDPDAFISYSAPMNYIIRKKKNVKIDFVNHLPNFLYLQGKEKIAWAKGTKGYKRSAAVVLAWVIGWHLKKVDKKLVLQNKLVFANSKHTKKKVDATYNINSVVSYPPLDTKFKPRKTKNTNQFIFSSSRIIPDKKYDWLVKIVSKIDKKIPCYVSGSIEPTYKKELEKLAKEFNANITFLGMIDFERLLEMYSDAAVFAFPTPDEDFGLVPAESMACGTPVVIWGDGAGPTEQVIDGINGYHAKPYDFEDYASKITRALNENLKKKNRDKIIKSAEKFSATYIKKDFINEIKKVVGR